MEARGQIAIARCESITYDASESIIPLKVQKEFSPFLCRKGCTSEVGGIFELTNEITTELFTPVMMTVPCRPFMSNDAKDYNRSRVLFGSTKKIRQSPPNYGRSGEIRKIVE